MISRGLGRGFDSLIPTELIEESLDPTASQDGQISQLRELKLSDVQADPDQPRRKFDEVALAELAASIKEHGVLQPIVVVATGDKFEIVAGERRYRASKLAGLKTVPALVRTMDGQRKLEVSLIENVQRRDLSPLETATAYLKLRDQFNLSLDEIGKRVGGKSASSISNTMRLLRLPVEARSALEDGSLTEGQARPLVGASDDIVTTILPRIINEGWSARQIEQYVVDLKGKKPAKKPAKSTVDSPVAKHWRSRLGTDEVSVRTNSKGGGQIVIRFKSESELKSIEQKLG